MTDDEARELARQAQRGCLRSRDKLVEAHLPLCDILSREKVRGMVPETALSSPEDRRQECAYVLLLLIGDYDADGPVPFRSYARYRMRAHIWKLAKRQNRGYVLTNDLVGRGYLEPAAAPDIEEDLVQRQRIAWAMRILVYYRDCGLITERQYTFMLACIRGYKVADIAEQFGWSMRTVEKDLQLARSAILGGA